jgi:hypothetical protein
VQRLIALAESPQVVIDVLVPIVRDDGDQAH